MDSPRLQDPNAAAIEYADRYAAKYGDPGTIPYVSRFNAHRDGYAQAERDAAARGADLRERLRAWTSDRNANLDAEGDKYARAEFGYAAGFYTARDAHRAAARAILDALTAAAEDWFGAGEHAE